MARPKKKQAPLATVSAYEQEALPTRLETLMQRFETAIDEAIAKLQRMV